jgi:hypothetical protein
MTSFQQSYHVSGNALYATTEYDEDIQDDPRGFVHIWEEPKPHARYIMGVDPSWGLTGWSRDSRNEADKKTDNGAIEIFRLDAIRMPLFDKGQPVMDPVTKTQRFLMRDLQVAEFAAPIDAVEIARVANILGRMYAGDQEDQCECILESFPGPGPLTLQELRRLDYMNMWHWEHIADGTASPTRTEGWHATPRSVQLLWSRSRRHLMQRQAKILSPWLLEEYSNAVVDMDKMSAKAAYGFHDDRLRAANMCFWAGHKWTTDPERSYEPVTETPNRDYQCFAPTLGDHHLSYAESRAAALDSWDS